MALPRGDGPQKGDASEDLAACLARVIESQEKALAVARLALARAAGGAAGEEVEPVVRRRGVLRHRGTWLGRSGDGGGGEAEVEVPESPDNGEDAKKEPCAEEVKEKCKQYEAVDDSLLIDQIIISTMQEEQGMLRAATRAKVEELPAPRKLRDALTDGLPTSVQLTALSRQTAAAAPPARRGALQPPQDPQGKMSHWMKKVPVLSPDATFRHSWNLMGMICIIYETYAVPFAIAFSQDNEKWLTTMMNLYFIADVVLSFFTGYQSDMGVMVLQPDRIWKRYLRSWFAADLVAAIPWEWLPVDSRLPQVTKMVRIVRIARLLRLTRTGLLSDKSKMFIEENPPLVFLSGVSRLIFMVFCFTHWAACLWYMVGVAHPEEHTWISQFVDSSETTKERYVHSLYFALTTMTTVGYGDINPQNHAERCFAILLLLVASVVFASLMGSLTDLIGSLNKDKQMITQKMQVLGEYMKWRHVPPSLFGLVRMHLRYVWDQNKSFDVYEQEVMDELPPILRKELCYHIYGRVLRSAPFFAWMRNPEVCLKEMANLVGHRVLSKGDTIFRVGEPSIQIWVLLTGSARLSLNESLSEMHGKSDEHAADDDEIEDHLHTRHGMHVPNSEKANKILVREGSILAKPAAASAVASDVIHTMQLLVKKSIVPKAPPEPDLDGEVFHSHVLANASQIFNDDVACQEKAAEFVQRRWRAKGPRALPVSNKLASHMPSKTIFAPAYLGESCLWVPLQEWDSTEQITYKYNVRCESRVEMVVIPRSVVKDIIDRFSPWLEDRFDFYRTAVLDGIRGVQASLGEDVPDKPPGSAGGPLPSIPLDAECEGLFRDEAYAAAKSPPATASGNNHVKASRAASPSRPQAVGPQAAGRLPAVAGDSSRGRLPASTGDGASRPGTSAWAASLTSSRDPTDGLNKSVELPRSSGAMTPHRLRMSEVGLGGSPTAPQPPLASALARSPSPPSRSQQLQPPSRSQQLRSSETPAFPWAESMSRPGASTFAAFGSLPPLSTASTGSLQVRAAASNMLSESALSEYPSAELEVWPQTLPEVLRPRLPVGSQDGLRSDSSVASSAGLSRLPKAGISSSASVPSINSRRGSGKQGSFGLASMLEPLMPESDRAS